MGWLLAIFTPLNFYPMEFRVANLPQVGFHWGFAENERSEFNRGAFSWSPSTPASCPFSYRAAMTFFSPAGLPRHS